MSMRITDQQGGLGQYIQYRTIINNAAGIFPKTPIKVAGINAGRIKDIELTGTQALVTFQVIKAVKVTKYTLLRIKSVGLLGDKYLDIFVGEQTGQRLKEDSLIPSETGGGLDNITQDASEILKDVKAVIKAIKVSIAPDGKETPLVEIIKDIKEIAYNARILTGSLKRVVRGNEEKLNEIIANVHELSDSLNYHFNDQEPDALVRDLKKIGPVLDKARNTMDDLEEIVADVKAGRGTVGKLLRDEEVVDNVNETLAGVKKMVNKFDSIQTSLSLFSDYNTHIRGKSDIGLNVHTSPERFFRVGVVAKREGPPRENETTRTINGVKSFETESRVRKNTFTFNFQIGRNIHNWNFRAGVIESTGGLGIDYLVRNWNATFSAEVFDYRDEVGPNLRFVSEVHLWNVFYARVMAEDLVSKRDDESLSFGAGLRFNDEDIKGLIGFFF